ncbi:MAG: hypothetical protein AABY32_00940 [Nanoarchaeota archaeon]
MKKQFVAVLNITVYNEDNYSNDISAITGNSIDEITIKIKENIKNGIHFNSVEIYEVNNNPIILDLNELYKEIEKERKAEYRKKNKEAKIKQEARDKELYLELKKKYEKE